MEKNKCIIKKALVLFGVLATMLFVSDLYAQQSFSISNYKYSEPKNPFTSEIETYIVDTFTFEKVDDNQAKIELTLLIIREKREMNENFDVVVVGYDTLKVEFSDVVNKLGMCLYENDIKSPQYNKKTKTYDDYQPRITCMLSIEKNKSNNLCVRVTMIPLNNSACVLLGTISKPIDAKIEIAMTDMRFHLL